MAESHIDVRYVANLARINLTEDEVTCFESQLEDIMGYIDKLSEVDIEGIEPSAHAYALANRVRQDDPQESLAPSGLLQNAPDQSNNQLRVPKVVDA
jgi:aspartyl-tRNA(Asn)/glutamyl-tRNA(Gln) amidotransferase subunit C